MYEDLGIDGDGEAREPAGRPVEEEADLERQLSAHPDGEAAAWGPEEENGGSGEEGGQEDGRQNGKGRGG